MSSYNAAVILPDHNIHVYVLSSYPFKKQFSWLQLPQFKSFINKLASENSVKFFVALNQAHYSLSIFKLLQSEGHSPALFRMTRDLELKIKTRLDKLPTDPILAEVQSLLSSDELTTIVSNVRQNIIGALPDYSTRNLARVIAKEWDNLLQKSSSLKILTTEQLPLILQLETLQEDLPLIRDWKLYALKDVVQYIIKPYLWLEIAKSIWDFETMHKDETFAVYPMTTLIHFAASKGLRLKENVSSISELLEVLDTFFTEHSKELKLYGATEVYSKLQNVVRFHKLEGLWNLDPAKSDILKNLANQVQQSIHNLAELERSIDKLLENDKQLNCIFRQLNHIFDKLSFLIVYSAIDDPFKRFDGKVLRVVKYLDLLSNSPKVDGLNLAAWHIFHRKIPRLVEVFGNQPTEELLRKAVQFILLAWSECS